VVGYFAAPRVQSTESARVVAAEGTTSENRRRILWALGQAQPAWSHANAGDAPGTGVLPESAVSKETVAPAPAAPARNQVTPKAPTQQAKKDVSGTEIIESLNRAKERRRAAPKTEEQESPDQFQDYTEIY
jgi:hypothetical protein